MDKLILAYDLGGTKILTAILDTAGKVLAEDRAVTPAAEGRDAVIQAMKEAAGRVLDNLQVARSQLCAIGVGAAGLSDPHTGILFTSPHLPGWKDVPLGDIISREFGRPAYIVNDANAAALGELYYGAARGKRDFIYITVSTGIGGGIVINGELYVGKSGTAGELGHMTIDDKGPLCNCGNHGCWETLVSGTAMAKEALRLIGEGRRTTIADYCGGEVQKINAEAIHQAAVAGDRTAKEIIERNAYYLGVGLANLINIFSPELIVIGGGLTNIGDMLLLPAYLEAERRAWRQPFEATSFALAELGQDSGILGVAAYVRSKL